jgi:hypothetical protein
MEDVRDCRAMDEALSLLASSMKDAFSGAQVSILSDDLIDIRFEGLPAWKVNVTRQLLNNQLQLFVTQIDLFPHSLTGFQMEALTQIAASENCGLRGVSVYAIDPALRDGQGGLRVRASFVGQKGRSTDEIENLALDIMNVLAFARTLEDRVTDSTIAGEFSQELYNSRMQHQNLEPVTRIVSSGEPVLDCNVERIFSEVVRSLKEDLGFQVRSSGDLMALATAPFVYAKDPIEIVIRIPPSAPIFIAHAPLMKVSGKSKAEISTILDDLNSESESGHFEFNSKDETLCYTAWKHLTNDLRHFSFDHTVLTVNRAYSLAHENLWPSAMRESLETAIASYHQYQVHQLKKTG